MLTQLQSMASKGIIRSIDYHFARFIHQLDGHPVVTLTAAWVSAKLADGNVCANLNELKNQPLFGHAVIHKELLKLCASSPEQWPATLANSSVVSDGSRPAPLVFQEDRIYLRRYWLYERKLINYLQQSASSPAACSEQMQQTAKARLEKLFARNYGFLYSEIKKAKKNTYQKVISDVLDIQSPDRVCWNPVIACAEESIRADNPALLDKLDALVPQQYCLNWQKVAASVATTKRFSVISGGPGTGKTTTVVRLLAILLPILIEEKKQTLGDKKEIAPIIRLSAPTGKAAARLAESIAQALTSSSFEDQDRRYIPAEAQTLHALLGAHPEKTTFVRNKNNLLNLDLLVIDEASMVDSHLLAYLLEALPEQARLILLGDHYQLASVEAGGILDALCSQTVEYSHTQAQRLNDLTGFTLPESEHKTERSITDHVCILQKSYRFHASSGIGQLAKAVNLGDEKRVKNILTQSGPECSETVYSDITFVQPCDYPKMQDQEGILSFRQEILQQTITGYLPFLEAVKNRADPEKVLQLFQHSRLLSVTRNGPLGVISLNESICKNVTQLGFLKSHSELWFEGRPVMITVNDYETGLCNGDVGIALADNEGKLYVHFIMSDGCIHHFLPGRLPEHQTAFVMTVHKSQGSEFGHTLLVLPEKNGQLTTRELLYTGLTRAKNKFTLFASEQIVMSCLKKKTCRTSGLLPFVRAS